MKTRVHFHCDICNKDRAPLVSDYGKNRPMFSGYGVDRENRKVCHACAAKHDRAAMIRDGRTTLYLCESETRRADRVTNWPGSLSFPVAYWTEGRHNIAGRTITAYFKGPRNTWWSARNVGNNTQIAHCKRLSPETVRRLRLA